MTDSGSTAATPSDASSANPFAAFRFGRLPIGKTAPVVEHGAYPAKAVEDEAVPITARIFREGHDAVGATVVLTDPDGAERRVDMEQIWPAGLDIWRAIVRMERAGDWTYRIEAWADDWHTWHHNADIKLAAFMDIALVCAEGRELFEDASIRAASRGARKDAEILHRAHERMDARAEPGELRRLANDPDLDAAMIRHARRPLTTPTVDFPIQVDRRRALYGSWYEFFPRSQGAHRDPTTGQWHSGTLASSHATLEHIASLGFDVAYITPVHPIGRAFRKGADNTLVAGPDDPGSPWAIGGPEGGHDAIHPDLGTMDDFDAFVAKARSLGLEVALDFALQASPDHPWVAEHPEWFTRRLDGTIAYAENPPKKYQDIFPINFDNDPEGIYDEVLRLVLFWVNHGVTIFRVDNPHTKPVAFWDWLTTQVRRTHPEVLFFAEAFSRPEVMQTLAKVGFHMNYTYFIWRNTKEELSEYLTELSQETADFLRPNFFVNTPDINPLSVRSGIPAAFAIRMILAATMSPNWGIYSGYEFFEFEPLKAGGEEYLHSEKYEYRPRDLDAEPNLNTLMARLNEIRRVHPALQQLRGTTVLETTNDQLFAFVKHDRDDFVLVVCSLDPEEQVCGEVLVDLEDLGLAADDMLGVHDELNGGNHVWGARNYVRLDPASPAHIFTANARR
ncbi:alpha-1,4-glucan--maltose-1-phosphate maltosyltransferase [Brooklawnia cerclae]|uniref:Alpha-1,4-glucan:maltose-1-phosphate maltosyltransferase n=1 Tax=Brooklawnia cerclae TaxID=349934 RepID=A0ABX0SEY8_9ACTN|nr:starch synthase (maltosyl-transferring) [Brooklawnia cerclae]